jgi:hypothetical protein
MRVTVLLAAFLATCACSNSAPLEPSQGSWRFSGTIYALDGSRIGGPIAGAQLTVIDGVNLNASVASDGQGRYLFPSLEGGKFTVRIAAPGYASITPVVRLTGDTDADFALTPQ